MKKRTPAHRPTPAGAWKPSTPEPPREFSFTLYHGTGEATPINTERALSIRATLPDGAIIDIETHERDGHAGLTIRGNNCSIDVRPKVSNVVVIIPQRDR